MSKLVIRPLASVDFAELNRLEREIFSPQGEDVLCAYYLRLCTEFFADTCVGAFVDDQMVGYLLCFVRGSEAYCTTIAVTAAYQGSRVTPLLIGGLLQAIPNEIETCWFTVKPDNKQARALHAFLGAEEQMLVKNFYGPGDERIVSAVSRATLEARRKRFERVGLLPPLHQPAPTLRPARLQELAV